MSDLFGFEPGGYVPFHAAKGLHRESASARLGVEREAVFSQDGQHRLMLGRKFGAGTTGLFVGVNPSKAGAESDDPTISKLYGFGERLGLGRWLVGNKFSLISTDPAGLAASTPLHRDADAILKRMVDRSDLIVVGWGSLGKLPPSLRARWREVVALIGDRELYCWGTCADGHPRHPGRIAYETPLVRWSPPA